MRFGLLVLACALFVCSRVPVSAAEDSRRILHLLNYVAKDYPDALASGSKDELDEQIGFLTEARTQTAEMSAKPERAAIESGIAEALALVRGKAPADQVAARIQALSDQVARAWPMPLRVPSTVSWSRGKDLYAKACATCHGADGRADTPAAATMEPRPKKFTDAGTMADLSPARAYDTISYGIQGTPMPSFAVLPEKDRWDLAFYVFTLRPDEEDPAALPAHLPGLAKLAALTDAQLEDMLKGQGVPAAKVVAARQAVRATATYRATEPGGIDRARAFLETARAKARDGDRVAATHAALDAYLNGFESVEPFLKVVDAKLMQEIERAMQKLPRDLRSDTPLEEVEAQAAAIHGLLDRAEAAIEREKQDIRWFPFSASFLIMVREGLEALLVLAMLVTILGKIGCRDQIHLVVRGSLAALALGFVVWLGAQRLYDIAAAHREAFEGLTTLLAAALLYWAGLWMLSRLESQRWLAMLGNQLAGSISAGSRRGVVALAFLAVFREVVETILFYQALLAQYPGGGSGVAQGALAGVVVLAAVAYAIFALGLKLPLSQFFAVSSVGMLMLAVYMVGQGFVAIGAAGWLMPGSSTLVDRLGGPAGAGRVMQVAMLSGFCIALLPLLRDRGESNESHTKRGSP